MPIYEYECVNCGAVTDIKHGFKETATEACPQCGGTELKRLFNPASIVFKGSGFYVTDSRKANASGAVAGSTKGEGAAKSGEATTKTDAAAKSDAPAKKSETPASGSGGKGDAAA